MTEQTHAPDHHPSGHHLRPHRRAAGRGLDWWKQAWTLFAASAGVWVAMALILMVISILLGLVPVLGALISSLLLPVFAGGWMLAARKADTEGKPGIGDLFSGFRENLTSLLVLGAVVLAASLVIAVAADLLGARPILQLLTGADRYEGSVMVTVLAASMLGLLVAVALSLMLSMAMWFAPALVVFRGVPPVRAMSASLTACLENVLPFLVHGVLFIVAAAVASIPFGLGWIILLPVVGLTVYASYRDVYGF
jgi:hypothetical protein